ncbi:MerR family transcriptional regulator [Cellulomonas sp. ATA003]|uniref:MerR family transcriptional regulator n=1 Tax=Cellulomonas sp. ATA003 TaxID=3073064 RepID=UPI002873BD41|nr:MerR family transcriptional regulator [Cellulomonas sp. ATA003]WNB84777.1 MerR family transcriptional regulator [Cellulomonas sp. ATA003]
MDAIVHAALDRARPRSDGRRDAWTIGEVARLAGVTTRTLRHYDAVGLLRPTGAAAGGRRLYGRAELLQLQQILVLRELDVGLPTIAEIVGAGDETVRRGRLREHHARLLAERDRFDRLARTVESTLRSFEEGTEMAAKDLYAGFDSSQYEAEARERWGDEAVERSNASWESLGPDGRAAFGQESAAIGHGLAELMRTGADVTDPRVQALVERHHRQIAMFWTPGREAYIGLGQMYVDDERFTATYDAFAPGLAPYLRDSMAVYAEARLS